MPLSQIMHICISLDIQMKIVNNYKHGLLILNLSRKLIDKVQSTQFGYLNTQGTGKTTTLYEVTSKH